MLLQKALPTRELRLCFEDPEWEQLVSQILVKVTEVRAAGLTAFLLGWVVGAGLPCWGLSPLGALVLSQRFP